MGRHEGWASDGALPVPPRRCGWPAEKTLSTPAWPATADKPRRQREPAPGSSPVSHLITEPGKVPSPEPSGGCGLSREEDEQLLSPRRAAESRTRAPVPMDLPCQCSRRGDRPRQVGEAGDVSFLLGSPAPGAGEERQKWRFFGFPFPPGFTHHFRFDKSKLAPF